MSKTRKIMALTLCMVFVVTTVVYAGSCGGSSKAADKDDAASYGGWSEGEGSPDSLEGTGIDEGDNDMGAMIAEGGGGDDTGAFN